MLCQQCSSNCVILTPDFLQVCEQNFPALQVKADHVVVAVGLEPNTDLASSAGLETDPLLGGYRVNAELQACTDVWAVSKVLVLLSSILSTICFTE